MYKAKKKRDKIRIQAEKNALKTLNKNKKHAEQLQSATYKDQLETLSDSNADLIQFYINKYDRERETLEQSHKATIDKLNKQHTEAMENERISLASKNEFERIGLVNEQKRYNSLNTELLEMKQDIKQDIEFVKEECANLLNADRLMKHAIELMLKGAGQIDNSVAKAIQARRAIGKLENRLEKSGVLLEGVE